MRAPFTAPLVLVLALATACGGGSGGMGGGGARPPTVIGLSPLIAPYDVATGAPLPRWTDATLTLNADPLHPGKVVIFFDPAAALDGDSFFLDRNPFLGLDPDAVVLSHAIPGLGSVLVPVDAEILADRILLTPIGSYAPPLPAGQYALRVGAAGLSANGLSVAPAPVFHTFFVGTDPVAPSVRATIPEDGALGVSMSAEIFVQFWEGIDRSDLDAVSIFVQHVDTLAPTTLTAAADYPRMQMDTDGATLPTNGHAVTGRARDPLPTSGSIRVTVGAGHNLGGNILRDLNGNALLTSYTFTFGVGP